MITAALAGPPSARGASGGGSISPGGSSGGSGDSSAGPSTGAPASTADGNLPVSATGDGVTLTTAASALLSNQLTFAGTAPASDAGATIQIQRLGHETGWTWAPTAQATVAGDGTFSAAWSTDHIGRFEIRAELIGGPAASQASDPPTVTVTVYRRSFATQYGPGFYGRRTACGVRLQRNTIGLANRTLPCGFQVALYYRGRTIVVPVIDRGPYANGADWDLTTATARALGIAGSAWLGAVSLPLQP